MPSPLVECIPNFSEARRPEVVEAIVASIRAVPGVRVLDVHSDLDHNRTVVTFLGAPEPVEEAAFQSVKKAAALINLDEHQGEHPRLGAADVVPFVPIADFSMQACVEMARRLAKRVADDLAVPVYLYEEAATRPDRVNLEDIRRGQYEKLKEEMGVNPKRDPDFGKPIVGTAGATVIGARQPLIAFNVYLTSDDVTIANKIARVVRHSSGGLRFVKALGILVDGRAQVSMNLTNFHQTALARVMEMIRTEAARYGVRVHHSELVGLIPNQALVDAAIWYLQMDQFEPAQILESRLMDQTPPPLVAADAQDDFMDALASGSPTPGGGSASAYACGMAAALAAMVARLTVGKKNYAEVEQTMWQLLETADALRAEMKRAVKLDAEAFDVYMQARKLPKDTDEQKAERAAEMKRASINAARVPLQVVRAAADVLAVIQQVALHGNINAISDAGTAVGLARAAINGAGMNVRINLLGMENETDPADMLNELKSLETRSEKRAEEILQAIRERAGFTR